jgi:hypothetical protein
MNLSGRERTALPEELDEYSSIIHPVRVSNDTIPEPLVQMHFTTRSVMQMALRMLLFFSPKEIDAMIEDGITPAILAVPIAYVRP